MNHYITNTEHAARNLFEGIFYEHDKLHELEAELAKANAVIKDAARRVEFLHLNPDLDDDGISTLEFWNIHFDYGPEADRIENQLELTKKAISDRRFSVATLAGSLLQIAKQGISIVHGGLPAAPDGRMIGTLSLKSIIWQGRNQALHWEDGNFKQPVVNCFETLKTEQGAAFNNYKTTCLAPEVMGLLGWMTYDDFKSDLLLLL